MMIKGINLRIMLLAIISVAFLAVGCKKDTKESLLGDWQERSDFDGIPRSDAVGFAINGNGYVGTGYDGANRLADFWEYNVEKNYWMQKADFPGAARNGAVGFGIADKGYIGTGFDGVNKLNDFWEFDPANNKWEQKADLIGAGRYSAVGFAINDKGYIGTGYDGNYLKDFYEYSPSSDTWKKIIFNGSKRRDAAAFVINGKGYLVSGIDNGSYESEFWAYDQSSGEWTQLRDITNSDVNNDYDNNYETITRMSGVGFSINGKGYLVSGSGSSLVNNVWEYDPATDLWKEKTSFEGSTRTEAVGFGIGNYGYLSTGRSSSYYFDDIWVFDPNAVYDESQ
ncbi:hypothetical protein MNBD_BACTEROID01-608 [hydrothermal vent metagenome]|uniref:Galactose oxidase n=1 Tax=hydrothermal vent metagenome TaxID=652676 RepID=A0A3B0UML4_9ZZZZ